MDTTDDNSIDHLTVPAAAETPAPAPAPVTDSTPAAPAVAELRTIEDWATAKKLLPAFFPPPNFRAPKGAGSGGVASIAMSGLTGPVPNKRHYLFAAALAGERAEGRWPENKEVTEADFDAAIEKHNSHVCR